METHMPMNSSHIQALVDKVMDDVSISLYDCLQRATVA
jgi:hypothetical protein